MALHRSLVLLIVACSILACGELTEPSTVLTIEQIHKEKNTGVRLQQQEIITSPQRWQDVWQEIVANRFPKPQLPAVDFSSHLLVYVARGETADACRDIAIRRVELRRDRLEIFVADTRLPMSCSCPPVTVQPVHIVAVPRVTAAATFHFESATVGGQCN